MEKLVYKTLLAFSLVASPLSLGAQENDSVSPVPSVSQTTMGADTLTMPKPKKGFFRKMGGVIGKFFKEFNNIDTSYIEPQHYNYTVMLQNTNTYELYTLSSKEGQSITFAPDLSWRFGPYVGWRWVFLGYTVDLKNINFSSRHTSKKEFTLSLYSSMLGVDLFWRETGNDYHVSKLYLGDDASDIDTSPMKGAGFDGLNSSIKGLNLYYIFNHRKFSYPAAYAQSTIQRRSAGSLLAGIGVTKHTLEVDWEKLENLATEKLGPNIKGTEHLDKSMKFGTVKYLDISFSAGYAYNWAFAQNWLFNASLSMALAYNQSSSDVEHEDNVPATREFSFNNFNLDGIGRFGLVWNNMRWYAGASAILHTYNYKKDRFQTNNSFGCLNIYAGVNFGKRKK